MRLPRVRFTVRRWMLAVALVAVALGMYLGVVELRARWRRLERANVAIAAQVELYRRAAEVERERERSERERAARNREQAVAESEKPERAALWANAAESAEIASRRANLAAANYQKRADAIVALRGKAGDDLAAVETLASAAEAWLAGMGFADESFPYHLQGDRLRARVELLAMASGRSTFPTVAGPRSSVIEATAIWLAAESLVARGMTPVGGYQAETHVFSSDEPFSWYVSLFDPSTGVYYSSHLSFSDVTVRDYLLKHP